MNAQIELKLIETLGRIAVALEKQNELTANTNDVLERMWNEMPEK